jgi:hypothetical protein
VVIRFVRVDGIRFEKTPLFYETPNQELNYDARRHSADGTISVPARWFVLKERFSPRWHLALSQGRVLRHVRALGYANAWEISAPPGVTFALRYEPDALGDFIGRGGFALWCCAFVAAMCLLIQTRASATSPRSSAFQQAGDAVFSGVRAE